MGAPLVLPAAHPLALAARRRVCAPAGRSNPLRDLARALDQAAMECDGYPDGMDAAWTMQKLRDAVLLLVTVAPAADAATGAADAETDMVSSHDVARVLRRWALDLAANAGVALPGGEGA